MPKFAANLSMLFTELPFPQRFAAAASAGFKAVEFLFPYAYPAEDVKQWLHENDLQVVLFNFPPGDWDAGERGIAIFPERIVEFQQSVALAVRYAQILEVPRLHLMAGIAQAGADTQLYHTTYRQNIRYAALALQALGKNLMLEPINTRDMPGYFLSHQQQGYQICRELALPNLKLQMDCYHAQITDGDLSRTLERHVDLIDHVQIAGVPARHEPDRGEVHYPHIFALLDQLGYQGWVGCEYKPQSGTLDGLGWLRPYLS